MTNDDVRLIEKPGVFIIGRQTVDQEAVSAFLSATDCDGPDLDYSSSDAENLVELSGRLCYRSYRKGRSHDDYIKHILSVGHGSVTEAAVWNIFIIGISRSLSHELVRHRIGVSPSQESQRYVDASEVAFVIPPALFEDYVEWLEYRDTKKNDFYIRQINSKPGWEAFERWVRGRRKDLEEYAALVERLQGRISTDIPTTERRKIARETARSVLPNCAETRIALTGNARAWRNAIELRASRHADGEIRRLFNVILDLLAKEAPNLFSDYERISLPDGTFEVKTDWKKV